MSTFNIFSYTHYDSNVNHASFNGLRYKTSEDTDQYFDHLIDLIKKKKKQVNKLKMISIEAIKGDLDEKIYKSIVDFGIANMFDLGKSMHYHPLKGADSRIANIASVKAKKIIDVMYKHGYPHNQHLFYSTTEEY